MKEIASIIAINMMGKGFAVRWGGEEFLLIYENCTLQTAGEYLEKTRQEIISHELHYNEEILHITMTFGIVEGKKEMDIESNIKMADDLLYQGKMNGRNQITGFLQE